MKKRGLLARALIYQPRLLLMDEPFAALDAQMRAQLQSELRRVVMETGVAVLFVTHDLEEAALLSDRVVVIGGTPGRVIVEVAIGLGPERDAETLRFDDQLPATSVERSSSHCGRARRPLVNRDTTSAMTGQREDEVAYPQPRDGGTAEEATAKMSRWRLLAGRLAVLVVGVGIWQLVAGSLIAEFYLPKPAQVLAELVGWAKDGSLLVHIAATLVPAVKGFVIATIAAILLGYALAMAKLAAKVIEPFIAALYGIPIIALIPLMILWVGIGKELAVAVAVLASFFLMFYNVYFGIREVSQALIDQVMIAGGSKWDIAMRVRLPSALVWLVAGMKVAVPHSIVGVVVAEFLTAHQGLGFLLSSNAAQFNAAGTFAAVAMLAAISFVLDRLLFLLTRRALMWKEASLR